MGLRKTLFVVAIAAIPLLTSALGDRHAGAATTASEKRSARKARLLEAQRHGGRSDVSFGRLPAEALLAPGDCGDTIIEPPETCDPPGIPAGAANECRDNCTFCGDGMLDPSVELIANGDFELGTFSGWTVVNRPGSSGSFVLDLPGTLTPTSGLPTASNPNGGAHYAVSDMSGPGTHALLQTITIPEAARRAVLTFEMFVDDWSGEPYVNPGGLDHTLLPNQHARVDLLAGGASAFTTGAPVLANFYLGVTPGASPHSWVSYSIDITQWTDPGVSYIVRFAGVENMFFLHVGVDNVSVTAYLEACDDGNNTNHDGCSSDCRIECGNGTVNPLEECDDGNTLSGDGCSNICMTEGSAMVSCGLVTSGASIVREGVDVDRYTLTATPGTPVAIDVDAEQIGSPLDAMLGVFTSGGISMALSDDDPAPGEPVTLDPYLLVTTPPDGILDIRVTAFEDLAFDGGSDHLSAGPYEMSILCNPTICGDETIQPPETCDPPGAPPGPGMCRSNCTFCGDGELQSAVEECDDDNNVSGDGCTAFCEAEFCGDRFVQPGLGETCEPSINSVAIFRDADPWGSTRIQAILANHGIPFAFFSSSDMGTVSLASFDKVVIASTQSPAFYAAVSANAAWFDAYVAGGGILEFHGATHYENDWSALAMPAGLTSDPQDPNAASDLLTIVAPASWLVNVPNAIAPTQIDGWGLSAHGYFTGAAQPFQTIIREDEFFEPVLIEFDAGAGCVIATMMTVEWFGADPDVLENLLLRHCASDCRDNCTSCGDGFVQSAFEECDDGGTQSGDGCSAACELEVTLCGDNNLDPMEQCDPPGPLPGGSTCCAAHPSPGCSDPVCEDRTCSLNPACCSGNWDAACVSLASSIPDCVTGCASMAVCTATCCIDSDGDQTCDTTDNCPLSPNPGGATARFDRTIHAISNTTFAWSGARNVDWVAGNVSLLSSYAIALGGSAASAQTISAPDIPPLGGIFWWLVKPDCSPSTWTTGSPSECDEPGTCPPGGRDGSLPMP